MSVSKSELERRAVADHACPDFRCRAPIGDKCLKLHNRPGGGWTPVKNLDGTSERAMHPHKERIDLARAARLTWANSGRSQNREARAGRIRLFAYTWDGSKAHPGKPWVMRTDLPGHAGEEWRSGDEGGLRAQAEGILTAWLEAAGLKEGDGGR